MLHVSQFEQEKDNEIISYMQRVTGLNYSEEQLAILKHHGGMCILACAGSGKTSVMTHLIAKRIQSHEVDVNKLLCTTYSKGGAVEMETRLNKLLTKLGIKRNVEVKTIHAMYLNVLKYFGFPCDVIDASTKRRILIEACRENEVYLDDDSYQELDNILSFQINNLLSDSNLVQSYNYTLTDISLEKYSAIRRSFNTKKIELKRIDFDDMQLYMYSLLFAQKREDVLQYCREKWEYIYMDEAQDMSKIQYMILKKVITDQDKIVLVGDDDQAIYQWRGADPSILLNVCVDYDITRFTLTTNYRCAGNIVEKAAVGIKHNAIRSDKGMNPYREDGEIQLCDCGSEDLYVISRYAFAHIKKLIESKTKLSEIAVLCRNNAHLCILNNMLFRHGVYTDCTDDMKLTRNFYYKGIRSAIDLVLEPMNSKVTENMLYNLCKFMKRKTSGFIAMVQKESGASLKDTLGYICKNIIGGSVSWNGDLNIPSLARAGLEQSLMNISSTTKDDIVLLYNSLAQTHIDDQAKSIIYMYLEVAQMRCKNNENNARLVLGIAEYLVEYINKVGLEKTIQMLNTTTKYEAGSMGIPGEKLRLSTIHGAKGKEWENVIILADDNLSFPSFYSIRVQLNRGIQESDISVSIDEGRRLHYVAMTRAKKRLTVFANSSNAGIYLLEAFGLINSTNYDIINMVKQSHLSGKVIAEASKELLSGEFRYEINPEDPYDTSN